LKKSSRRDFIKIRALAGASMAMPALAQNTRVLTNGQAGKYRRHVWHSLGIQPQRAVLQQLVDPLPIPPVIRPATGSITRIDMKVVQKLLHRDLPPITARKAVTRSWARRACWKRRHTQLTDQNLNKQGTFVSCEGAISNEEFPA